MTEETNPLVPHANRTENDSLQNYFRRSFGLGTVQLALQYLTKGMAPAESGLDPWFLPSTIVNTVNRSSPFNHSLTQKETRLLDTLNKSSSDRQCMTSSENLSAASM
jgi:hypothetical protein